VVDTQKKLKRKYELKQRAAEMAATRERITEAAVELHGTVGPARTTMSAVAKRASVQRHTVLPLSHRSGTVRRRSSHYLAANPWPDPDPWRAITNPQRRLAHALEQLYAYYERTEPMLSNVFRDAELVDAVRPTLVPLQTYLAEVAEMLMVGWSTRGGRRRVLAAALHHAIDLRTWRSLAADRNVVRTEAVELVSALVEAAAAQQQRAVA
jgi:AcrR family transcriptional regulator